MKRLIPNRGQLIDMVMLVLTCFAVLIGLGSTFTGVGYAVVGLVGLLIGVGAAHLGRAWRLPFVAPVAASAVVFFLLGGPLCLRAAGGAAPGPSSWSALADQAVFGWKELLTTLPPVDGNGPLLALPWLLGLAAGVVGGWLAGVAAGPAWWRAPLPVLAPAVLLAVVILLGLGSPDSVWIQGVVVAVLALGWLLARMHRMAGPMVSGRARWSRLAIGSVLVGIVAVAAAPVGTWAAGGEEADQQRLILRNHVEPPFDVGRYPSPLAAFRKYVEVPERAPEQEGNLYDTELMSVTGVPEGTRVRFATLDYYDGVVWNASNNAIPGARSDTYQRVGSVLTNPADGPEASLSITLGEGWSGVWLPEVGAVQEINFATRTNDLASSFRYNLAASAAVVPIGLQPGDRYSSTVVLTDRDAVPEDVPGSETLVLPDSSTFLDDKATEWSGDVTDPMQRVFAIADQLRTTGKYSDGILPREAIYRPGHFVDRLDRGFINADLIVGNDEQYAATMALLANKVGVPARVVLGAVLPEDGVVKGENVSAWVELQVADGSWRTLPTETFMSQDKPAQQQTRTQRELSGMVIPPPAQVPPPSTMGEQADTEISPRRSRSNTDSDRSIVDRFPTWLKIVILAVGGPLLALVLIIGAILLLKSTRRSRRRKRGPASSQIVAGWRELVDHARDLGHPIPLAGVTRSEQSGHIASPNAPALARWADVTVFGRHLPPAEAAGAYWSEVAAQRKQLSSAAGRWRRMRAALSLRTFWRRTR